MAKCKIDPIRKQDKFKEKSKGENAARPVRNAVKKDVYDMSTSGVDDGKQVRHPKRSQKLSSQQSTRNRKQEQPYDPKNEAVSIGRKIATSKLLTVDKDMRKDWPSPIYSTMTEAGIGQRQLLLGKANLKFAATPTPLRSELGIALNVNQKQPETSTPDLWNQKASKNDDGRVTRSRVQNLPPTLVYNDSTSGFVSGSHDSDFEINPQQLKTSAVHSQESYREQNRKTSLVPRKKVKMKRNTAAFLAKKRDVYEQSASESSADDDKQKPRSKRSQKSRSNQSSFVSSVKHLSENIPSKSSKTKDENSQQAKQEQEWTRARMSEFEELDSYELLVE